jgi:tetratricopeptide (TPR) repeat protein
MKTLLILISLLLPLSVGAALCGDSDAVAGDSAVLDRIRADSLFIESIRLKERGEQSHAYFTLLEAYSVDSTSSAILAQLAGYFLEMSNDSLAIESMRKAVEYTPEIVDYKVSLAALEFASGNIENAVALYEEIASLKPYSPADMTVWVNLLGMALMQGTPDEIIKICDRLIPLQPDVPDFYFHKSVALYTKNEYSRALAVLEQGISFIPAGKTLTMSLFYGQMGDIYYQTGKVKKAYECYDKALDYNEDNFPVMNNYAYFLSLEKKSLDRAEQMSGRCVGAQPANSTYLDTYAWIFFQKGNYAKAKLYLESAISNGGGESPDILEHYGDVILKLGNAEKAATLWKKALEIKIDEGDPDIEKLQKKIKEL